jgi:nitrate reductase cytochrome c-type subunit
MRDNYSKKMTGAVKIGVSSFANLEGEVRSRVSPQIREFSIALEEMQKQLIPANNR